MANKIIEPVIIQGINKDVAPGALDYSGRKILNPVRDVLNARYLTSDGSQAGKVENIKGTTSVTSGSVLQEITENGDFTATLDPWLQLSDGSLTFAYSSGTARVSTTSSGFLNTNTLYQLNEVGDLKVGTLARFSVKASSNFSSASIFGRFLDEHLAVISSFSIGGAKTSFTDAEFSVLKEIPEGAKHIGVYMRFSAVGSGSKVASMDYCKIQAQVLFELPAGQNECIGTYENVAQNALYYWMWNSNGYHGVFKYDGSDESISQILADDPANPVLKFDRYHLITGIGMIGDILTWTDNLNPQRYTNTTRTYATLNDQLISLAKIGPKNAPTFSARSTDTSIVFNRLASDSFQFAFQYVYMDNEISILSPYSKLCTGDVNPKVNSSDRSAIFVTHTVDSEVSSLIKEVRLLYRKNNDPQWYIWKQVTSFSGFISQHFYNNEQGISVPESQSTKLFDLVPNISRALTIFRGRVFLNINEEGFEFTPPTVSCRLSNAHTLDSGDIAATNVQSRGAFIKKYGSHLVGVFFRDHLGRLSGISSKGVINGDDMDITSTYNINDSPAAVELFNKTVRKFIADLAGVGPPNTEYFVAITKEQNYAQCMQVPAHVLWYVGSAEAGNTDNPYTGLDTIKLTDTGRVYLKNIPTSSTYKYIHLLLPKEIPWIPDKDCYVRFVSQNVTVVERVLDVLDGDILVVGSFGVLNWSIQSNGIKGVPWIEVFKPNTIIDPLFYQASGPYTTDANGALQTKSINCEGDIYMVHLKEFSFRDYFLWTFQHINSKARSRLVSPKLFVESTTPIASKTVTKTDDIELKGFTSINISAGIRQSQGLTQDLTKAAFSKGWPLVEAKPLKQYRPATIRFSDPYIEGSEVNGLNSFPVGNIYDKIGQDRSPITKLIPVGNVLVAVHERHVTTMYVGEGIVRTGETGFLSKVEGVVGDDRKLIGEMGSYHPESIQEIDGQLFGYDIYTGVVWRYTVEGMLAISRFGMENYFKERSEAYFPNRDQLRFVSSVDKYHKEYLITMPHLYATKETVARQTVTSYLNYDFILDPSKYTVGETYRLKIVPYNQTADTEHRITLQVLYNDDPNRMIYSSLTHKVTGSSQDEADAIYIEFTYAANQAYITLGITTVTEDIYVDISSEYQELSGETWAYNYLAKQWSHRTSHVPEYMGKVGTQVIGFKNGVLYKHNESETHNNFYGVQYQRRIEAEVNPQPNKDHTWSAIQVHSDELCADEDGTFKVVEVSNDHGQASYTRAKEFDRFNGLYDGPILKDINTNPSLLSGSQIALRDGKDMRSQTLNVVLHNDSTGPARMQKFNVVGEDSEFSI